MGDRGLGQAGCRQPGQMTTGAGHDGSEPASPARDAPGAPPEVRTALSKLRDAAAAHDDELPAPGPPVSSPG